ncbi:14125_t:CDS:2, partial [Funneliformis geosporum]
LDKLLGSINGLKVLHDSDIIHRDYHSGNIFYNNYTSVTGDLGLRQEYTKASDVYGFGMIMWEWLTGRRPFWNRDHDVDLIIDVCDGLRPPIVTDTPEGYVKLMQECWHSNPKRRPTADDIKSRVLSITNSERTKYQNGRARSLDDAIGEEIKLCLKMSFNYSAK